MDKDSISPNRSRRRPLFWVALIVAFLLSVYCYRYELILLIPSVQADRLAVIAKKTRLPFPSSSQVVEYDDLPFQGPFSSLFAYLSSWPAYWYSWQHSGAKWYRDDLDLFFAKVVVPEDSYLELEDVLLKAGPHDAYLDKGGGPYDFPGWWNPQNIQLSRQFNYQIVFYTSVITTRENGRWAIYIYHEAR